MVLQNIAVKIYYKNKNNTSFLYVSLKSRKTYNLTMLLIDIKILQNHAEKNYGF